VRKPVYFNENPVKTRSKKGEEWILESLADCSSFPAHQFRALLAVSQPHMTEAFLFDTTPD